MPWCTTRQPTGRRAMWDANGNIGSGYSYDIENRLLKAGTGMPQYAYDAGNKRIARDAEFTFWAGSQKWATYTTAVSGSVVTFTLTGTELRAFQSGDNAGLPGGEDKQRKNNVLVEQNCGNTLGIS